MKTCSECHVDKPDSEFYTAPSYQCKPCKRALGHARYAPRKAATKAKRLAVYKGDKKRCKICKKYKATTEYTPHADHWDRLSHECRACKNKLSRDRYTISDHEDHRTQEQKNATRERAKVRGREYYQEHKAEHKARYDKWRKENPEASRAMWRRYDNRRRAAGPKITKEQFQMLVIHYCPTSLCLCCGKKRKMQTDHVISLFDGGTNDIGNIQPLCHSCNCSKGHWHNTDYRPDRGEYARSLSAPS